MIPKLLEDDLEEMDLSYSFCGRIFFPVFGCFSFLVIRKFTYVKNWKKDFVNLCGEAVHGKGCSILLNKWLKKSEGKIRYKKQPLSWI